MRVLIIFFLFTISSFAKSISIPLYDYSLKQEPASDLEYKGQQIDSSEAAAMKESNFDISKLNPIRSNLFHNTKLKTTEDIKIKKRETLNFEEFKTSPTEIFRFFANDGDNKKVLLTASLDNHTNVIRSLFLRSIGFDINRPTLKDEVHINFKSEKEKENFLEKLSEQTLTSRARWIISEHTTSVKLRHILIDQPQLRNVNLYLPVMTKSRQANRRVFRSLLGLYAITDFPESINKIKWSIGKVFNNKLSLTHPYATSFKNTTEDDLKWIVRKLNQLKRDEITQIVKEANYPVEVESLIVEKLISRMVSLSQKLRLNTHLNPNLSLTNQYVVNGKLISKDFNNSAINYSNKDIPSPYRFKELFRLFGTQAVFNGLSELLDKGIENTLPGIYSSEATNKIQNQINDFKRENPNGNGTLPLRVFTSPTLFGRLFANRNIVFGRVMDTNAAIQLVDSVGAEVNLGLQGRLTGVTDSIVPNLGLNTFLSRTYTHVRAMPDLKTASRQKINKILVPKLMKKLGKIIKSEYLCTLSKAPFVDKVIISNEEFHYIKYDETVSSKDEAIKLRDKLISDGIRVNQILIIKIDRKKLCAQDIVDEKDKSIEEFLKSFAENETFIISDSLRFSAIANASIPLISTATFSLGVDQSKSLIRSIQLKKINEQIQVTVSEQNDRSTRLSESINFFIRVARNSDLFQKGKQNSKIYTVNLKEEDQTKQKMALRVIRELFIKNDKTELYKHYKAKELRHKVKSHINTLRLLWFKRDRFKMGHDLSVIIPNLGKQDFSLQQRTRKFHQHLDFKRTGSDFHSFTNDILGFFSDIASIGEPSSDPGKTFLGNSKKAFFLTEAEVTKGSDPSPTTRIEFIRSGWNKKHRKINKYFNEIDQMFSFSTRYNPIDRSILKGSTKLQSFDIRSTIILYPNALKKLQEKLVDSNKNTYMKIISFLEGKPLNNKETRKARLLKKKLWRISKSYKNIKDKVKEINQTYKWLFTSFNKSKVLSFIGEENFFATTRVVGFLKNHHKGFLEHSTDTIGTYNEELGTGIVDKLSSQLGISSYQLRALTYSPGIQ